VWRTVVGSSATVQTHYIFDEAGHLLAEHNGATGAVLREYVWLDDTPLAMIDSTGTSPATYFIHTGQIEEPLMMTDATKAKVWDAYVEPFGMATVFGTPSAGLDLRLPGQFTEAETGALSQNWNRDYDTSLGRYIQADPLGIEAGQNVYGYVDGDPLTQTDWWGLQAFTGQAPPVSIPGGPWTAAGPGQLPGDFFGPKQSNGGKLQCRYVPDRSNGGPPGARKGYWKIKLPGQKTWSRYNLKGQPISSDEAHPESPKLPPWALMGALVYILLNFTSDSPQSN
jgi:RHS repeat-associated protein